MLHLKWFSYNQTDSRHHNLGFWTWHVLVSEMFASSKWQTFLSWSKEIKLEQKFLLLVQLFKFSHLNNLHPLPGLLRAVAHWGQPICYSDRCRVHRVVSGHLEERVVGTLWYWGALVWPWGQRCCAVWLPDSLAPWRGQRIMIRITQKMLTELLNVSAV